MTARDAVIRLAVAALLLIAIGVAGHLSPTPRSQVRHTPKPRIDLLQHQWMRFCPPFSSEICAGEML